MTTLRSRIDSWLDDGPFTGRDLGIYRIIYAGIGLVTLKQFAWLGDIPSVFFDPPPGPFRLASGFPSSVLLGTIDIALALFMASLLVGLFTRTSSIAVFLLLVVGEGFSYSTGKIDHSILYTVVPAVMAFSGWGGSVSVDAWIRPAGKDVKVRQWLVRLLGFCVGVGMLTAGLPKLYNGWLNLDSQASFGYQAVEYYVNHRQAGLSEFFVHFHVPWYWEVLDWATVIIECAVVIAAFSWRFLRLNLALLTVFHLGVLLSLTIAFSQNMVVYAAFVSWSLVLPWVRAGQSRPLWPKPQVVFLAVACVLVVGLTAWWIGSHFGADRISWIAPLIVLIGAAFGIVYLVRQGWNISRGRWTKYGD